MIMLRSLLRSPRFPPVFLLTAAALALLLAQTPLGPVLIAAREAPGILHISAGHAITDALLVLFFVTVAIELRHELSHGTLRHPRALLVPAAAAAGGILVPLAVFAFLARGTSSAAGWPIPTATDVAFALGVLAVVGRGLPQRLRIFVLTLAILDDVVGIVLIAVVFTTGVALLPLCAAAAGLVAFVLVARRRGGGGLRVVVLVVLGALVWLLVLVSGVHPTIAGVALGLALPTRAGEKLRVALTPAVDLLVLPLFAFSSALLIVPQLSPAEFSPAFWGVVLALPLGKFAGIVLGGAAASWAWGSRAERFPLADLAVAGALGGIGFTVSLLLAELAFPVDAALRDEAVLGVLCGSAVALLVSLVVVGLRARHYRRLRTKEVA